MANIHALSGNSKDVQDAITAAVKGDRVIVPAGDFVWTTPVTVDKGTYNIAIIGGNDLNDITNRTRITGTAPSFINYTFHNNSPKSTGEVSYFEFTSENFWFKFTGQTEISSTGSPPVYTGGFRFHHNRYACPYYVGPGMTKNDVTYAANSNTITSASGFSTSDVGRVLWGPASLPVHVRITAVPTGTTATLSTKTTAASSGGVVNFTGTTPSGSPPFYDIHGWVNGVFDHCEFDINLLRFTTKAGDVNNYTAPDGSGFAGDYSRSLGPLAGRQELGGGLNAVYFEDCIIHYGSKALTDAGGPVTDGGGAIIVMRHCNTWAALAVHGTRESGSRMQCGRMMEMYNNNYLRHKDYMQSSVDTNPCETRDGEQIFYNNYISIQTGGNGGSASTNNWGGGRAVYLVSYSPSGNYFWWGPDGCCPFDLNAKGKFTDTRTGFTHEPYASYNPSTVTNGTFNSGFDTVVNGVDTTVAPGDSVPRYSDVYGIVSGGSYSLANGIITNANVVGTNILTGGIIPANFFRGFVIRDPSKLRSTQYSFTYITSHTASTGGSPNTIPSIVTTKCNIAVPGPFFNYNSSGCELRFITKYFGPPGQGSLPVMLKNNPAEMSDGSPLRWQDFVSGGIWEWGNMRRVGNGAFSPTLPEPVNVPPDGTSSLVINDYHYYNSGPATDIFKGAALPAAQEFQPLFNRGYKWDATVPKGPTGAGPQPTRVGADWSKDYFDPVTGQKFASTVPNNPVTPEFASFYADGVGGLVYPHPLIQAPAAGTAPTITSQASASWTNGVTGQTFTVVATGDATISYTMPTPGSGGVPSWLSLASSTGVLSGTPSSAGTSNFVITATNSSGSDTQNFQLVVTTPLGIKLDTPLDGAHLSVVPATITLGATVTGGSGTDTVTFYSNGVSQGTDSTTPYAFVMTNVAAGTYQLKAQVSGVDSNINTVTVAAVAAPTAPTIIAIS